MMRKEKLLGFNKLASGHTGQYIAVMWAKHNTFTFPNIVIVGGEDKYLWIVYKRVAETLTSRPLQEYNRVIL